MHETLNYMFEKEKKCLNVPKKWNEIVKLILLYSDCSCVDVGIVMFFDDMTKSLLMDGDIKFILKFE